MSAPDEKAKTEAASDSALDRRPHAQEIIRRLREAYPGAHVVLDFASDWELLVAVILSAQCTDKMVNQVTAKLFKKYHTIEDYAGADVAEFEADIRPTGFFRNKTKHIIGAAQKVLGDFGGEVPASMPELLTLPGVARKTANIVLGNAHPEAYAKDPDAGIAVDTHVGRLSQRLGLASSKDPEKIERELMAIVPREEWQHVTYLLIEHGRAVCTAKRPHCGECFLQDICPSAFRF
jgi:endonuclease-3